MMGVSLAITVLVAATYGGSCPACHLSTYNRLGLVVYLVDESLYVAEMSSYLDDSLLLIILTKIL